LLDVAPIETIAVDRVALENPVVMILTEASLPAVAAQIWRGQVPWIAATRSLSGVFAPALTRITSGLAKRGKVRLLAEADERIAGFRDWGDLYRFTDTFSTHEAWMDKTLGIDGFDYRFGEYAVAAKQISCNLAFQRYLALYRVHGLLRYARDQRLTGFDAFDIAFLRDELGNDITATPMSGPTAYCFQVVAGLCRAGQLAVEAVRVAVRQSRQNPKILMNCDHINDEKDYNLWLEVPDRPEDVRVVFRNRSFADPAGLPAYIRHWATMGAGALPIPQAFSALAALAQDLWRLSRKAGSLPTEFFFQIVGLPRLRLRNRAFLHRFPCEHFMGRDDYNPDHIMRSLELRRIGATSLGIMHGLPAFMRAVHQIRYIDFDTYYVFGRDIWTSRYRDKWPIHMTVRATGAFGLSREEFKSLKNKSRRDIMIIANPCFQQNLLFQAWIDIAKAFPDRHTYISAKKGFMDLPKFGPSLRAALENAPKNISIHTGRTYELFGICGYAVNEASTLAAEAVQCGMASFVLDLDPRLRYLFYRRFPDICVSSADELIKKIRLIEADRWQYPIDELDGLIPTNGVIVWDVIRSDLGIQANAAENVEEVITELELQR
jgi:hypothetical protein